MIVRFVDEFAEEYQRNNKRTGQKNLRCFPVCGASGHLTNGFCGRPICVEIGQLEIPKGKQLKAWGEIVQVMTEDQRRKGDIIGTINKMREQERTKGNPLNPLLRGDVNFQDENNVKLTFNRELIGWHYYWVSTKHTCQTQHVFRISLFIYDDNDKSCTFIASSDSPSFRIYSRRRIRVPKPKTTTTTTKKVNTTKKRKPNVLNKIQDPLIKHLKHIPGEEVTQSEDLGDEILKLEIDQNCCLDRLVSLIFHVSTDGGDPAISSPNPLFFDQVYGKMGLEIPISPLQQQQQQQQPQIQQSNFNLERDGLNLLYSILCNEYQYESREAEYVISSIRRLTSTFVRLGRNNQIFLSLFDRWMDGPDGLRLLKEQILYERENCLPWTKELEFETFDVNNFLSNKERTIYGLTRHSFRRLMQNSLKVCNLDLSRFAIPMEAASKSGIVLCDPLVPPPPHVAGFVQIQLNGGSGNPPLYYDYNPNTMNKNEFGTLAHQQRWARDLVTVKRAIFRKFLCDAVLSEQKYKQYTTAFDESPQEPIPQMWDISGTWLSVEAKKGDFEHRPHEMDSKIACVLGLPFSSFFARAFSVMFAKIDIKITKNVLQIQGEKVLLANPRLFVPLNGVPRTIRFPVPLPSPAGPLGTEKLVNGWIEREGNTCYVNWVVASQLPAGTFHQMLQMRAAHEELDQVSRTYLDVLQNTKEEIGQPELRMYFQFIIEQGKQQIIHTNTAYLYKPNQAPNIADLEAIKMGQNMGLKLLEQDTAYVRCYVDQQESEFILDLLAKPPQ